MKSLLLAVVAVCALPWGASSAQAAAGMVGASISGTNAVLSNGQDRPKQDSSRDTSSATATTEATAAKSAPRPSASAPPNPAPQQLLNINRLGSYLGLRVVAIQLRGIADQTAQDLLQTIPQKVNQPLDRNKLRGSVQTLYASGRFSDLQVEADKKSPTEVTLTFVAKENYFIGALWLRGAPDPPTSNQLINSTKLNLGDPFSEQRVNDGIARIKRVMEENGYYHSRVSTQKQFKGEIQQVYIWFTVMRGTHARVGQVKVTGNAGYAAAEIQEIAKLQQGDEVTVKRVTRALTRLRKKYQGQDRLEAQVALTDRDYHADTDRLDYTFGVDRGPKVDIRLEGARLRKGVMKKYVPIYEENALDEDLLNESRRNLRDYFQTKGYFDVGVDFEQTNEPAKDLRTVKFAINRGKRHKVVRLIIRGNSYFDADTLRERMQTQPADLLLRQGRYSQSYLTRDKEAIENLYKANGFERVQVTPQVQDDYQGKRGHISIVINVEEGPQTRVTTLQLEGVKSFPQEQILNLLSSTEGQPYSDQNIAGDRDAVISYYYDHGFPNAQFDVFASPLKNDPTRMSLRIRITEGEQVFVNRISVAGLRYTRPYIVKREFQLHEGDALSQRQMISTQRQLYDLTIFNGVNMAVANPEGREPKKDVLFQMDEAKRYTFTYGFGLEAQTGQVKGQCQTTQIVVGGQIATRCTKPQGQTGFSPRVSFDVTRINFRGRNHTLTFKSRLGNLQQRALVSYEAPRLFNRENWSVNFTSFYDKTQDVLTFTAKRLEGSVQARQQFNKPTTLLYRFTYRRVQVDQNSIQVSEDLIPLLSRPTRIGMPSFSYIRDTRDEPLDAHKGEQRSADLGLAGTFFGSQANFSRFLVQESTYHAFNKKKWVFARSTRLGIEHPFGRADVNFVPLPERFFTGGSNSHRGFAINQAGPRDPQTGFPLGGNALLLNNLEVRTPPIPLPFVADNISAVVFHDMGNVFASSNGVLKSLIRFSQPHKENCDVNSPAACDFNYISHGIGAGLRYRTPIGPVRVDFGYNLNPPTFPVRIDPSRGPHTETLGRFNFFFSIGQTF